LRRTFVGKPSFDFFLFFPNFESKAILSLTGSVKSLSFSFHYIDEVENSLPISNMFFFLLLLGYGLR